MDTNTNTPPIMYEIRLRGRLDQRWATWFDDMQLIPYAGDCATGDGSPDGDTLLRGPVIDQSALHGLLDKIRSLNLQLISVNQIDVL